ncbi:hypothetical protein E2C01_090863 [Portunus trituberculatus]|uniref:Uncharacterized protein n=1 Tax=Portunus trituberculatus TaxID=210409 RepID=A0A5B7JTJ6_PORTR|nr:hypothetical protein [Portunus trituberculatus]
MFSVTHLVSPGLLRVALPEKETKSFSPVKGPEARNVAPVGSTSVPTRSSHRTPRKNQEEEDVQAKLYACIFTAKALAGTNYHRLQELIPLILQHNGLPAVYIPLSALSASTRTNTRLSRRGHPGAEQQKENTSVAAPNLHHTNAPTEKGAGAAQRKIDEGNDEDGEQKEEKDDVDEENEKVNVVHNSSEDDTSPAATKPAKPSQEDLRSAHDSDAASSTPSRNLSDDDDTSSDDEEGIRSHHIEQRPPAESDNQTGDEGWVTKKKRQQRAKVAPTPRITPPAALRESSGIATLRRENKSGRVCNGRLDGYSVLKDQRYVGTIVGYDEYRCSYRYPTRSNTRK